MTKREWARLARAVHQLGGSIFNPGVGSTGVTNMPVNNQTGTTYTFVLGDAPQAARFEGIVTGNNAAAITFTVPNLAWTVGALLNVIQLGAGAITLAAGVGVTLITATSLITRAVNSTIFLVFTGSATWVVGGDTQ